jgi:hypothetical protein
MNSPFTPAAPGPVKVLLYGAPKTGKTCAGLSFPRLAVVDTEAGSSIYAGRPGVAPFSIAQARSLEEVIGALTFIHADGGKSFDTVMLYSVTPLYDKLVEQALRTSTKNEVSYRDRSKIGIRLSRLFDAFTALPVHLVVTAHEVVEYRVNGGELTANGIKPKVHADVDYAFDFVIRMNADHSGVVELGRGIKRGTVLKAVNWSVFAPFAGVTAETVA